MTTKRFFKKTGKIILYTFGSILLLLILVWIFINTDYGKRIVRNKIQAYLEKKLQTKVIIGEIDYSLPKWVEIKNLYIEDRQKDTLLFGEKLAVDLDMIKLIRGNTYIRKVEFKNIYANITRAEKDSFFNFQFIVDAFAGNKSTAKIDIDTAAMKLTLKRLILDNVLLKFTDKNAGSDFIAQVKNLDATLNKFQPDRLQFGIDKFINDGMSFTMTTYKTLPPKNIIDTTVYLPPSLFLTAGLLDLKNVNVTVDDKTNGMYYKNTIHHLGLNDVDLDLAKEKATANILLLDSSFIKFITPKPAITINKKDSSLSMRTGGWEIAVKEVSLTNNIFRFDDNNKAPVSGLDFAHLDMNGIKIKGSNIHYTLDSTIAAISQLAFKDKSGFSVDTTHALLSYTNKGIIAKELYIKTPQSLVQHTVSIAYDDVKQLTTAPENSSIDIQLANSTIAINDVYALVPAVKQFMEPGKFANSIIRLNTRINGSLATVNIPVLQLAAFNGTVINAKAILYNVTDMNRLGYDITIFNSTIPRADLAKFLPNNNALAKLPPVLNISTNIKGGLNDATGTFNITGNNFRIYAKGNIKNIKNPKALQYNLAIKDSRIDKSFITAILPPNTLPENIQLPETITIDGTAKGDMNNIQPDLKLGGSYGTVAVKGYIKNFKDQQAATYDLQFATNNFALGKLIRQDSIIGNITMNGTAKGRGFDYKTMHSAFKADVQSAGFNKYNYQNASIDAALNSGQINSTGNINDPNIKLNYTAAGNVRSAYPSNVEATVNVDTIQLHRLHLYKDSLTAAFKLYVKAPSTDPNQLNAVAYIDTSRLTVNNKSYILDSIIATARTNGGINDIALRSPFASLTATGQFEYDKIGQSIAQYIDKYYNIGNTTAVTVKPQKISFEGEIKKHSFVTDLVQGLQYENIPFKGSYASQGGDSALNLIAAVSYFSYQGNTVSKGNINIVTNNDRINGVVNFDTLRFANNIFYKTNITANAANDSIGLAMVTKDQKDIDRFGIGANIKINNGNEYTFSLKPNLLLNYKKWDVEANNRIVYSPEGVLVNNFSISSDSASISATSTTGVLNSPVDVTIQNFNIREITSFLNRDTLLASGILDGKFVISDFRKELPSFTGNLALNKAEYKQQPVGDLKIFAEKRDDNSVNAIVDLTGNGNDVSIKGHYYLNNANNEFDAELDIKALQLSTLQAFSDGAVVRSSGTIRGDLALNGKFADPRWNGDISFDTARFTLAQLGTPYLIDKQSLSLNYPELVFEKFTIQDSANNSLVLDGTIRQKTISEYDLDLKIKADDFMLVNSPRAINNQVYGFAAVDADIIVTGNSTSPDIQGSIALNDKTDMTIVLPESNINKDAAQSVVRFIDRDTFALPEQIAFTPAVEKKASFGQFINYNLNIEVTKNAALTIIIDPSTGDELRVQGDAQLNAGVNPSGEIVLTGNYELNKGYYVLNYQFLRREFNLLPGSTITFSGEPTDAQVNITAEYIVNTSAKDLLSNEVAGMDAKMANTFNQKLPFKVLLYLKGPIKKPSISFDIQMPDENSQVGSQLRSTIENKLAQLRDDVAATNKQVFSLLLLNRFVGEQSSDFFKGNGSFDQLARESVSKFLSSALDQIAGDIFKGVDVDLNLNTYEDYSTGDAQQKTDLNVAITKTFLDDRLSITVGKNFGIEGQDAAAKSAQKPSNLPDVTINYKLTKDGRYSIRAYKKNQFEVILDGYVVETGVAFVVTMDYDKFRELFQRRK